MTAMRTQRAKSPNQTPQRTPTWALGFSGDFRDLMSWDREIFADFVVEPLTPYKPGVMQMVRVMSASKIVVTEKDKIVLRKDKL